MKYRYHIALVACTAYFFVSCGYVHAADTGLSKRKSHELLREFSPLAEENRTLLFNKIVAVFDSKYRARELKNRNKNLADSSAAYYLQRELQALIDMWRATGDLSYLNQAKKRTLKAITDAEENKRVLLWRDQQRGIWPCFFAKDLEKITGGHGQLGDFQGSAGFMMVANALNQAQQPGWEKIADFVEKQVITKWLFRNPNITLEHITGPKSNMYLLTLVDSSRGKRAHFAAICIDLYNLGYKKYPYERWSKFLADAYLGGRESLDQPYPNAAELGNAIPKNWSWGVIRNQSTGGFIWYWRNNVVPDTSHANRTVWFAAKAYHEKLIDRVRLEGFIKTLKNQVWALDKGPFYFNNFINGQDSSIYKMGPGQSGNVWFGWHRLAAYDNTLKQLFISMAYDLTNGGPNIIGQNKGMEEAPLCLFAWGARLLSPDGKPEIFP